MKATKQQLQKLLDRSKFIRHYGFRVVKASVEACVIELPHRPLLERPGGIINGPALMAAADCAMWLAVKVRIGVDKDALTSVLNTAFLNPAKGGHVYCTARVLKLGRRLVYGVAESVGTDGTLLAHHTVTYARPAA